MHRALGISVAVVCLAIGLPAYGATILLSEVSSDETPPELLAASLDFSVSESELTLVVTNLTDNNSGDGAGGYDIISVFFNSVDAVTGLVLQELPGWSFREDWHAGGFGTFDNVVQGGNGPNGARIDPGESQTFFFDILGQGPFNENDFVLAMSTLPPGELSVAGASKFVRGPNDDSAFGASIPEPGSIVLLCLGGLFAIRRRRF